jgi:hypothetical protein
VRSSKGDFTTFDAPGAGTGAGQGTRAYGINPAGEVTGWYSDSGDRRHGYVRDNKGTITTFDAPGAGTGAGQGTFPDVGPNIINPAGAIVGHTLDANFVAHGFVRDSDGTITTFDAPGAGSVPGSEQGTFQGTFPLSINPAGAIAGVTQDASNVLHGFLRDRDGTFTTFDAPGAGNDSFQGTGPSGINPAGSIVGSTLDANFVFHGFLRGRDGIFTTFDAPGAGSVTDSGQGTTPSSINPAGATAGSTLDANFVSHGFLRDRDRTFTTFDVPGAGNAPGEGTFSTGNNPSGKITGTYIDSGNLQHGFLRTP